MYHQACVLYSTAVLLLGRLCRLGVGLLDRVRLLPVHRQRCVPSMCAVRDCCALFLVMPGMCQAQCDVRWLKGR